MDTTGGNATYSSPISSIGSGPGRAGSAKVGPNTLYLTGANNSYTGGTLLGGGTLDFTNGALPLSSNSIYFNGGTLAMGRAATARTFSACLAAIPSGQTANFDTNGNNVDLRHGR